MPFDPAAPSGASDTLTLVVAGQSWTGWQRVAVTRSMDQMPASFQIEVTEKYPTSLSGVDIEPGQACQVMIGSDLVLTGWVDRYTAMISARDHTVTIAGRSLSEDLVDCSAFIGPVDQPSFQVLSGTTLSIAQQLAQPYNVTIQSSAGSGLSIPQFHIAPGETVWEIIDRITRYSQMVAYDNEDGTVQFAQAGSSSMASGFMQGQNVEQATVAFSMDQRFSVYEAHILSSDFFSNQQGVAATAAGTATDNAVTRFRKRFIISEQSLLGQSIALNRATWECNRRKGRSQAVTVRCDGWRDSAGALWDLNHLAPVEIPAIKVSQPSWLIGAVTFTRDETGQHALVTLMPQEAYMPEPVGDLGLITLQDIQNNNPAATPNPPVAGP